MAAQSMALDAVEFSIVAEAVVLAGCCDRSGRIGATSLTGWHAINLAVRPVSRIAVRKNLAVGIQNEVAAVV